MLIVRFFVIELVEGNDHGLVHAIHPTRENLGADLNAMLCVDHHEGGRTHPQGGKDSPHKVICPWGVDDVELAVHELGIERGRID